VLYKKEYEDNNILNNISIYDLAEVTKLSADYLYKLKNRKRVASYDTYKKIISGVNYINSGLKQDIDLSFIDKTNINLDDILSV